MEYIGFAVMVVFFFYGGWCMGEWLCGSEMWRKIKIIHGAFFKDYWCWEVKWGWSGWGGPYNLKNAVRIRRMFGTPIRINFTSWLLPEK